MTQQMTAKARQNPFTNCKAHAIASAEQHLGYKVCPYRLPPYRSHWLAQYDKHAQIPLPLEDS